MDPAALAFADARNHMVDSQLRPNRVIDPRILAAMRQLPRERFLPAHLASFAYLDEDVPLGGGRALMEPLVLARLVQAAALVESEQVLVVGAGTGYGAAVAAACGARVTALEEDAALLAQARPVLAEFAPSVSLVSGPLAGGWPAGAPYDVILIEGAVRDIPPAVGEQLRREVGRLVTVRSSGGAGGQAIVAEATAVGLRARPLFDCATPAIPSLLPAPGFVF